ncbi:MAG TPA: LON peptidase substrate-binding domain-containing protein [Gaiellaceae bacterium]|nr:LON peptidase substrate-binding domain-containing protein [Gaiellaceae bacterium]
MEIGLFPLELVLMPTERVPLHIFEPRYKELIGECLRSGLEFGLVLEDEQGRREIGTRAVVVEVLQVFDDGRMNVVVEGHERFRLRELTTGREFLTGEVEPVDDDEDDVPAPERDRALALFRRLVEAVGEDVDEPDGSSGSLAFEIAARVDFGTEPKQELLELRSEPVRLGQLCELLEGLARLSPGRCSQGLSWRASRGQRPKAGRGVSPYPRPGWG